MKITHIIQHTLIILILLLAAGGAATSHSLAQEPDYFIYLPLIFKAPILWEEQTSNISSKSINGVGCEPTGVNCAAGGQDVTLKTNDGGTNWSVGSTLADVNILDVSCGSASLCVAAGVNSAGTSGVILYSTDGGQTWTRRNEPYQVYAVDCPNDDNCNAVGKVSEASFTRDGGTTWITTIELGQRLGNTDLFGVDCVDTITCWMVGDGGRTIGIYPNPWGPGGIGVITKLDLFTNPPRTLYDISCVTQDICVSVGQAGVIARSTNATGRSWDTSINSGVIQNLNGVSCPTASRCYAVGDAGTMLKSVDGGITWGRELLPTNVNTVNFEGIECFSEQTCLAVGSDGTILYRYSD